jgi:toxin ParE1/3/4
MARVIVSLLAQTDNAHIIIYLAGTAGHTVAAKYASDFEALYERLAIHPECGPCRPAIGERVRIGIVSPYVVIYEHDRASDIVTILRIVHGRRRITGDLLLGD